MIRIVTFCYHKAYLLCKEKLRDCIRFRCIAEFRYIYS